MFLELNNRYVLECSLRSDASLHVGTGLADDRTDAPLARMQGKPFLPGSSLRGTLRSHLERIVNSIRPERAHILFTECAAEVCVAGNETARDAYEQATNEELKSMPAPALCPVCQLFGSTLQAARLKITDAVPVDATRLTTVKRDGVGIDRDTETAADRIKYDFEVLETGAEFGFEMHLDNARNEDLAMLYVLLLELRRGIDVGGKKSRGLGRVRLTDYRVRYFDGGWGHDLLAYLESDLKEASPEEFETRLKSSFTEWMKPDKEAA